MTHVSGADSATTSSRGLDGYGRESVHNQSAVMRVMRRALAVVLPLTLLAACGSPGPQPVTYTGYYLTCCVQADVDQVWQPNTTVDLHWIVESSVRTTVNPTHRVTATAALLGPYADV